MQIMPFARSFGPVSILALTDGAGTFFQPREEAFPDATAEQWRLADAADPGARTADGQWLLRFRCFAVRPATGPVILVDAGIGPAGSLAAGWAPVPGRLPAELAEAGIDPAEVGAVVLTHLHSDHVGWAVVPGGADDSADSEAGRGRAYFPNARYVVPRADAEAYAMINPALGERLLDPLRATGRLDLTDGSTGLAPGIGIVPTPGHTPGHQSVLVETPGHTVLLSGDLLLHAIHLVAPDLAYAHDMDPGTARGSRTAMLRDLAGRGAVLAAPHLTEPFIVLA
jgi:glyoxylase-like metal-dependent hydrolase (beta-lactamase superfamily II)